MADVMRVRSAIENAVRIEAEMPESIARDVAFHMTDWLGDLERLHEFCQAPESLSPDQVEALLLAFLAHVPNHLAAASKLLTGIPVTDIFGVGAITESDERVG